ncbi:GNAT family N-acetyltransferase [Tateyamaria sp.]|jgi:GNAT superfamily N-acetyltransferase|uniref:GNAT family N-acetyltransferase n=2 Tax=Tateyamaria sp. TaxID=1929288 RepID=UPI0032DD99F0
MKKPFEITDFTADHIEGAVLLSQAAGWAHGYKDWEMLLRLSTGRIAICDSHVVGTGFRMDFGPNLSALNMIIVSENMRSQGLGRSLMLSLMQSDSDRAYRLIATRKGRPLYEKLGFEEVDQLVTVRGLLEYVPLPSKAHNFENCDRNGLVQLESASFGGYRAAVVDWLLANAKLAVVRDQGVVQGFAARRLFGQGYVIGPVVTGNPDHAKALITHLVQDIKGDLVRLDVTNASELTPWLQTLGLSIVDAPPVMQRGVAHLSANRKAVFNQALG